MANRIPGDPIPGSIPWGMILRDEATKVTLVQMLWGALCPTMDLFSCRCPVTGPPLLLCLRLTAEPLVASSIRQDYLAQSLLPDETCPESGVSTNHHTLLTPPFQNYAPYLQLSLLSFIYLFFCHLHWYKELHDFISQWTHQVKENEIQLWLENSDSSKRDEMKNEFLSFPYKSFSPKGKCCY